MGANFMREFLIAAAIALCLFSPAAEASDNPTLAKMFQEDQFDRRECPDVGPCFITPARDPERQRVAMELLQSGQVRTANDYFHAALIFQHATSAEDSALAHALASVAARIDPKHRGAKWLAAAAWDRTQMRRGKPQWYGTQFAKASAGDGWELYTVDERAVTDEDRKEVGIAPLAELREQARKIAGTATPRS
jgi:hypothetical protein